MADRWAVATGNWSNTATWNGGTLPTASDIVYADGYTVTIDQNVTVLSIRTTQRSGGTAGGLFNINGNWIITADLIAGTQHCLSVGNYTFTIVGNVYGSSTTVSAYGIFFSSTGVLTIQGNIFGGALGSTFGVRSLSSGTVNITGTVTAGGGIAVLNSGTGNISVTGNVYGSSDPGIRNSSSGNVTIVGDVLGGVVADAYGVDNGGTGTISITGNVTAGSAGVGAYNSSTGKILISGNVTSVGSVQGTKNTNAGVISIGGNMVSSDTGYLPFADGIWLIDDVSDQEFLAITDAGSGTAGTERTLTTFWATGGPVCGGTALVSTTNNLSVSGGVVSSGVSYNSQARSELVSGGLVASGVANDLLAGDVSDALIKCGTIISPAGTGNQTYTVSNFGGTPKLLILWGSVSSSEGVVAEVRYSFGAATSSSNRSAVCVTSRNNQDTTDSQRYQANNKVFAQPSLSATTVLLDADLVSFGVSGNDGQFTLNWTTNTLGAGFIINYMLIGGNEVEANIMEITSYTGTGTQTYAHGLSGSPTTLINYNIGWGTAPPSFTTHLQFSMGFWDGSASRCIHSLSRDINATSSTWRITDNKFIRCGSDLAATTDIAEVSSVDNTNITLNWTHEGTGTAGNRYNWIIALRGIKSQLSTFNVSTTNGNQLIAGLSRRPDAMMFLSALGPASTAIENGLKLMLGADDGTNSVVSGMLDENGQNFSNTDRFQNSNKSIQSYDYNQSKLLEAEIIGFGPDKAILDVGWCDFPARDLELSNQESLSITSNSSLQTGDVDFWLSCWFKAESHVGPGFTNVIISKASGEANVASGFEYWIGAYNLNSITFNVSDGSGVKQVNAGAYSLNTLYHVFAYHEASTNTIGISVNGGAWTTATASVNPVAGSGDFFIGKDGGINRYFDGLVSRVAFGKPSTTPNWTTLRDSLYNSGRGKLYAELTIQEQSDSGLVSYWNLNESSGNALDSHGSNNLTDNNTVGSYTPAIESYEITYFAMSDLVYPMYQEFPSGGVKCGGTASVQWDFVTSGGVVASASAWVRKKYELVGGAGGSVAGGVADVSVSQLVGGLVTGGSAFVMSPAPYRTASWARRLPFMKHLAPTWPYQANKDSYQYQGLVAWWPSSMGGSKLIDVSGRGYHGTHYGGTTCSVTEKGIQAISYDGIDDYTNCGQTTVWNLDKYTITGWFKTSIKTHRQGIINKKLTDLDANWDIFIWGPEAGQTNGTLVFSATNGQIVSFQIAGTADYADGEWHSFAAVVNTNAKLYVDGILVADTTANLGVDTSPTDVMLGADRSYDVESFANRTDRQFNGLLEDIRIYNNSLPEVAILQICDPIRRFELYQKTSLVGIFHSTEGDFASYGGTKVGGGAAVWVRYYSDVPSGGLVTSGSHPVLVHGGTRSGGTAAVHVKYAEVCNGGVKVGAYTGPLADGGAKTGGSAIVAVSYTIGGGTKASGNITSQITYYSYPSGGVQLGGLGFDNFEFPTIISAAGVVLNGTNVPEILLVPPTSGGLSLSGIAEVSTIHNPTADAGVVIAGFGSEVHRPTISGGIVASGVASELRVYGGPPLTKNFISFVYSGGTGNADPDLSLGGDSSSFPVSDIENNLFDDILGTDVSFGATDYRSFYVFNDHPEYTLYDAKVWIEITDTVADISIGIGTVNAIATSIGIENNAPSGVSFSKPFAESDAITVGDLAPLDGFYVWVKRTVAPNTPETNGDGFVLHLQGSG